MCWSTTPIHGSAGADSTLIDTVGQKLRGIPAHVRSALAGLFEGHHVVVLGHSGGDLEFGNTLALCMRLLSSSGRTSVADTIWQHLADTIDRRKSPTMVSLEPAVRALAAEGHRLFGIQARKEWACRLAAKITSALSLSSPSARRGTRFVGYLALAAARTIQLSCLALSSARPGILGRPEHQTEIPLGRRAIPNRYGPAVPARVCRQL